MQRHFIVTLASLAALAIGGAASAQEPTLADATPVVETEAGSVQGLEQGGIDAFLGVRYAAPPLGDRRFQPPVACPPGTKV